MFWVALVFNLDELKGEAVNALQTKTDSMPTLQQSQQLQFLQNKIQEIGSAIFFNLSDSVLKLPTSIVSTLTVDEYGYVWFFVKKPHQKIQEFEKEFPVRLDFFKKGVEYFLQVSGKAWVVTDPEEVNGLQEVVNTVQPAADTVLVKVKMLKAEYYETQTKTTQTWWQSAINSFTTWFRNNTSTIYYPAS